MSEAFISTRVRLAMLERFRFYAKKLESLPNTVITLPFVLETVETILLFCTTHVKRS